MTNGAISPTEYTVNDWLELIERHGIEYAKRERDVAASQMLNGPEYTAGSQTYTRISDAIKQWGAAQRELRDEAYLTKSSSPKGTATDRQRIFLKRLAGERDWSLHNTRDDVIGMAVQAALADGPLEKQDASQAISAMLKLPVTKTSSRATEGQDKIPAGKYALPGADGVVKFFDVSHGKGKWDGYVFVLGLTGAPGRFNEHRLNRTQQAAILGNIGKDVQAALALFGRKFRQCGLCSSPLSQPQSRVAGYGEKCAKDHGYWYPTLREALELLQENGTD